MNETQAIQRRMQRIEKAIQHLQSVADPATRAGVEEVIGLLLELHGIGLDRMLELIAETGAVGDAIINDTFVQDEYVSGMLLLHGLHPVDVETRVVQSLDKLRPYLRSHGGNAEFLGISDGVVRIRLEGSSLGYAASVATLKTTIETQVYNDVPDVLGIEVEGVVEQVGSPLPTIIPLEVVARGTSR